MSAADQISQTQEQLNWHWRNSMRPIRFFKLDARAVLPFCFLLFYARLVMLFLAIVITLVFWIVEKMGLTFPSALRKLRTVIVGDRRPALLPSRQRKFTEWP